MRLGMTLVSLIASGKRETRHHPSLSLNGIKFQTCYFANFEIFGRSARFSLHTQNDKFPTTADFVSEYYTLGQEDNQNFLALRGSGAPKFVISVYLSSELFLYGYFNIFAKLSIFVLFYPARRVVGSF